MTPTTPSRNLDIEPRIVSPSALDLSFVDDDALRAVERLQARGSEAYLVGGCVRDLLLHRAPKDYDIATSARPQQIKRIFPRNCRIIGRRFKLAHLHFDGNRKILEVSTFRRAPSLDDDAEDDDTDLLITRDNEFGTAVEDALRRDFTVNALFLDAVSDRIVDYVGGLDDVAKRVIRTIGDPGIRFREDPVRILRAIKFASRLGFTIDPATFDAMVAVAPDLVRSAPPRLLEEILRLLRGGHALDSLQLLRDIGALRVILPVVDDYLARADHAERSVFWRLLDALDGRILRNGAKPPNGLLLGALFTRPVLDEAGDDADADAVADAADDLVQPFAMNLKLPKRDTACLKFICGVQPRLAAGTGGREAQWLRREAFFDEALELFTLACAATETDLDTAESWRRLSGSGGGGGPPRREDEPRGRRRRGGRPEPKVEKRKQKKKRSGKRKRRRGERAPGEEIVETIEPVAIDVTAFEVELSARRAPSFGTIVEGQAKKKRRPGYPLEDDDYKPPPPSGGPDAPPPPPRDDGGFGDW